MRMIAACAALMGLAASGTAMAQSPEYMMEDCRNNSRIFFQDFEARSDTKYEGQRVDGTHAVNGKIYLETRSENFQCSYNRAGNKLVDFYAEGKKWPAFVRGEGSPHMAGGGGGSEPTTSTERVRFPSGSNQTEFAAVLTPGSTVRYKLGAKKNQFLDVSVSAANAALEYRIFNPDGSALLDMISIDTPYRGQLWQRGDHVVEVINRTGSRVSFDIYFRIE